MRKAFWIILFVAIWLLAAHRQAGPEPIAATAPAEAFSALRAKVTQFGGTPLTGSSAEFEKLFVRDSEKWAKVVQAAGARTQ